MSNFKSTADRDKDIISLLDSSDGSDMEVESSTPTVSRFFQRVDKPTPAPKNTSSNTGESIDLTGSPQKLDTSSNNLSSQSEPVKPATTAQPVNPPPKPAQTPKPNLSAEQILQTIPSATLPDSSTLKKPNIRQVLQSHSQSQESGLEIDAQPDCLLGLTFVVTGQLPNLGRDEIQSLIKRLGGNVTSSLSKKTSCMVMGEDAGPSKIQKAKTLKLKVIDEQGFINFVKQLPASGGTGKAAELARAKRKREEEQIAKQAKLLKQESSQASQSQLTQNGTEVKELWTTKYAPKQMSDICGNNAAVNKLSNWIKNWQEARKGQFKGDGSEFKAAILSGPPGIGKTTTAHLIGKQLGYDIVEYNASDTRSKSLLNTQVAQTLSNRTLTTENRTKKLLVIMDEVDGMGAGDRGGVGAMAALAKSTNVPLILICNERNLPKMRPFDRCAMDVLFRRPDASQLRSRIMSIAQAEGLKMDHAVVDQLVQATRSDIRQMLNLMENYRTTKTEMGSTNSKSFTSSWNKQIVLKPFDIASKLLTRSSYNSMSVNERMDLYFHDYDFAPLMLQENYLQASPSIKASAQAAEDFSLSDLVDKQIHQQQQWSLMPLHALTTCVLPPFNASGQIRGRLNFTAYLGNNSKGLKYKRLLNEIRSHLRLRLATSSLDLRLEFQPVLADMLLNPLLKNGADSIADVIEFMDQYYLTKEDWDVIMELGVGFNSSEKRAKGVPTAVKTAFTRKYNQMSHPLPFMRTVESKAAAVTGRKRDTPDNEDVILDDVEEQEDENKEGDTLETAMKNDKYITKPKAKPKRKTPAKPRAKK